MKAYEPAVWVEIDYVTHKKKYNGEKIIADRDDIAYGAKWYLPLDSKAYVLEKL